MKRLIVSAALAAVVALPSMAQLNDNGYYRMRNAATNRYVSLTNDTLSYQYVINGIGGSNLYTDYSRLNRGRSSIGAISTIFTKVGIYMDSDISLVEDYVSDPGTIIYLENIDSCQYNLAAQGVNMKELTAGSYVTSQISANFDGAYVDILSAGDDTYTASIALAASASGKSFDLGNAYFYDKDGTFSVYSAFLKQTDPGTAKEWYIEPVGTDEANCFGVACSENMKAKDGHYYATLCVDFPFEIPSGSTVVSAYSVTGKDQNGYAVLKDLGSKVAGGMPVVLECTSTSATSNKLLPVDTPAGDSCVNTTQIAKSGNYLRGRYFNVAAESITYYSDLDKKDLTFELGANQLINNKEEFRVLNIVDGVLGFYRLKDASAAMAANKAFLNIKNLPTVKTNGAKVLAVEDESGVTGISYHEASDNTEQRIYDLQGRRVSQPQHGLYIVNGKKMFVK